MIVEEKESHKTENSKKGMEVSRRNVFRCFLFS